MSVYVECRAFADQSDCEKQFLCVRDHTEGTNIAQLITS